MKKIDLNELGHYFAIIEELQALNRVSNKEEYLEEVNRTIQFYIDTRYKQLGEAVYTLLKDFDKDQFRFHTKRLLKLLERDAYGSCIRSDDSSTRNPSS